MRQTIHSALSGVAAVLLLSAAAQAKPSMFSAPGMEQIRPGSAHSVPGTPVALSAQPGSQADTVARELLAPDLVRDERSGDHPMVLVGEAPLGSPKKGKILFVQLQSEGECGSGGCTLVSFQEVNGHYRKILDTIGGTVRIAGSYHRDMPDLIVADNGRLVWDGAKYSGG